VVYVVEGAESRDRPKRTCKEVLVVEGDMNSLNTSNEDASVHSKRRRLIRVRSGIVMIVEVGVSNCLLIQAHPG